MLYRRWFQIGILFLILLFFGMWEFIPIASNHDLIWNNWNSKNKTESFQIHKRTKIHPAPGAKASLWIAATSDLHGSLISKTKKSAIKHQGLLHLAPIIQELRNKDPDLILLDAGDTIQGNPSSFYFSHVRPLKNRPLPVIQIMNALQYDALTLGNHDFEPPLKILKQNIELSDFPWLAANVLNLEKGEPILPPYTVFERSGIRIGVLGITTPGIPIWIDDEKLDQLRIENMLETAKKWVPFLKEREKIDFLIGLFHSGDNTAYDLKIALEKLLPIPNAAGQIADFFPEFDLIISGHSHKAYPKRKTRYLNAHQTPVVFPGTAAQGLSLIQVNFVEQAGRWKVEKAEYDYRAAGSKRDEKMFLQIQPLLSEVQNYLDVPTKILVKWPHDPLDFKKCSAALNEEITKIKHPNSLSLLPEWAPSDSKNETAGLSSVTRSDLFEWIRYDNRLVLANLFGRQIEILLQPFFRNKKGVNVRRSSILAPGGFIWEKKKSNILKKRNGSRIQAGELYPVWLTNYHWNGGAGLASKALIQKEQLLKKEISYFRDEVFAYLQNLGVFLPKACNSVFQKSN